MKMWRTPLLLSTSCLLGIILYMSLVGQRVQLREPDEVLPWTAALTTQAHNIERVYLSEPFLNALVAWDSEYYLSIAIAGFDDPAAPQLMRKNGESISGNYAFMPLYPWLMHLAASPLILMGINTIPAHVLAGMLISVTGAIAGSIGLYRMISISSNQTAQTALFYFLVFPTAFYLVTLYTEGLFVGLTFFALLLINRHRFLPAMLLAAVAIWVRPVAIALMLPMAIAWWERYGSLRPTFSIRLSRNSLFHGILLLLPLASFLLWRALFGEAHAAAQEVLGRSLLNIPDSVRVWGAAFLRLAGFFPAPPETRIYYLIEFSLIIIAILCCIQALRVNRLIAVYSLGALALTLLSGTAVSQIRYLLPIPAIYLSLALWGRGSLFDRAWSLISILLLALLALLFSSNFWVA